MNPLHASFRDLSLLAGPARRLRLHHHPQSLLPRHGALLSRRLGQGMEYAESRPYQDGDDSRHLDARLSARTGQLYSKCFQAEHEQPLVCVVDQSISMHFATRGCLKSVLAARLAALFAWAAQQQNDRIGASLNRGDRPQLQPFRSGMPGLRTLLHALSRTQPEQAVALHWARWLQHLAGAVPHHSLLIWISDFAGLNSSHYPALKTLARHHELRLVHVYDPLEAGEGIQPPCCIPLLDPHTGQQGRLDLRRAQDLATYQQGFTQRCQELARLARSCAASYQRCATHQDLATWTG